MPSLVPALPIPRPPGPNSRFTTWKLERIHFGSAAKFVRSVPHRSEACDRASSPASPGRSSGRVRVATAGRAAQKFCAHSLQEGQFAVGESNKASGLRDLDPKYKRLLAEPVTMTLGLIGPDDRIGLTPMWFDYEGDKILVNTASHRRKCEWIRKNPRLTILLVNPNNPYHWVQIKCTVEKEMREWEPGGEYVTKQLDRIWTKYTGKPGPYALRDPKIDEKRVLFVCGIDRIATFGEP